MDNQHAQEPSVQRMPTVWCKPAVISFVFGLLPLLLYLMVRLAPNNDRVFFLSILSLPLCALVGLVTGIIGIVATRHRRLRGLVLSLIGVVLSLWWLFVSAVIFYGLMAMEHFD